MADLQASLSGIVPFIAYFITAIVMLLIFMKIYTVMTPHDEMALIKENNVAASVVFSAAFLGFSLPLASAAAGGGWRPLRKLARTYCLAEQACRGKAAVVHGFNRIRRV